MRATALALAFALLLAGCGDKGSDDPVDDPFGEQEVAQGKGLVRGLVVSAALTPVEGATVELLGANETVTTDANGAFTFLDLEPGSYFVRASKPGWSEAQQAVDVEANENEPPVLKVLLERIPGTEPRVETQKFEGFISCSVGIPITDEDCNTVEEQHSQFVVALESRPTWIQTEIVWDSTQPAGDTLYVIQGVCECGGAYPPFDQRLNETAEARSPYVARADPEFLAAADAGGASKEVLVDVSASGPALGTGVAVNQEFTLYVTLFYNLAPLPGWTFAADGDHPLPA